MIIEAELFENYVAVVAAMSRMQMALEAIAACAYTSDKEAIAKKALEAPKVDR